MLEFIQQPWPWWLAGLVLTSVLFLILFFGQSFGISSNLRTICAAAGAGKRVKFFQFNWKTQAWNLVFLAGAAIGGLIAQTLLTAPDAVVQVSEATVRDLNALGLGAPTSVQPEEIFGLEALGNWRSLLILIGGGLLVGFGSRYAGGCTSGHAISGLTSLQVPSLIAVVGFFLGGLVMTHFLLPVIF